MKKRLAFLIALVVIALGIVAVIVTRNQQGTDTEGLEASVEIGTLETTEEPEATAEPEPTEEPVEDRSFLGEAVENGRAIERVTTFVVPKELTGDSSLDTIIQDMVSALSIRTYWQENDGVQTGLRVAMGETDILTADVASKDDTVYLYSDLLADTTVSAQKDDLETVMDKMISLMERKGMIDAEQAQSMRDQMKERLSGADAAADSIDMEALIKGFEQSEESMQEWLDYLEKIAERVQDVDLSNQPENSDTAIRAVEITLTAEDMVTVYEKSFAILKGNEEYMKLLESTLASAESDKSAEEMLDAMLTQIRTQLPEMLQDDVVVTIYLNGDDEIVAVTGGFTMAESEERDNDPEGVTVTAVYTRHTEDGVVTHNLHYDMAFTGAMVEVENMAADISFSMRDDGVDAAFKVAGGDVEIAITLTASKETSEIEQKTNATVTLESKSPEVSFNGRFDLSIEAKKDGDDAEQVTTLKFSKDDQTMLTIITESKTVDPYDSIATEEVLSIATMSDDELDNWFDKVQENLQVWGIAAIQALPTSVLLMMMGVGME